tara:strand:- start:269 stop:622 length:354 start_codon:yes stop_codon:yes gene_type:complete
MEEFYDLVERSIDCAFEENKFYFKAYDYLKANKIKRKEISDFISSSTADTISQLCYDLDHYIKGGKSTDHRFIREAYGHLGKPRARKIKDYLYKILQDAWQYEIDRRPGRKKVSKYK